MSAEMNEGFARVDSAVVKQPYLSSQGVAAPPRTPPLHNALPLGYARTDFFDK
jgi:hypothetical protein